MIHKIAALVFGLAFISPALRGEGGSLYFRTGVENRSYPIPSNLATPSGPFIQARNAQIANETNRAMQNAFSGAAHYGITIPESFVHTPEIVAQVRWVEAATFKISDPRMESVRTTVASEALAAVRAQKPFELVNSIDSYLQKVQTLERVDPSLARQARDFGRGLFVDNQGVVLGLPDAPRPIDLLTPWASPQGQTVRGSLNRLMLSKQIFDGEARLYCGQHPESCNAVNAQLEAFHSQYDELSLMVSMVDRMSIHDSFPYGAAMAPIRAKIDFFYGVAQGLYGGASDFVTSTAHLIRHPISTLSGAASGLSKALVNYPQTYQMIKGAVQESFHTMLYGTAQEKGAIVGRLTFEVASALIPVSKGSGGLKALGTLAKVEAGVNTAQKIARLAETGRYALIGSAVKRAATVVAVGEKALDLVKTGAVTQRVAKAISSVGEVFPETVAHAINSPGEVEWLLKAESTMSKTSSAGLHTAGLADPAVAELFKSGQGAQAAKFLVEQGPEALAGVGRVEKFMPGAFGTAIRENVDAARFLGKNAAGASDDFLQKLAAYGKQERINTGRLALMSEFEGGATKFMTKKNYEELLLKGGGGGKDIFITSARSADDLLMKAGGQSHVLEKGLGIKPRTWQNESLVRLDIPFDFNMRPRLPSGLEASANEYFKFGGMTSGGLPELIVSAPPLTKFTVRELGIFK